MAKDFDTLSGQIKDPKVRKQLASEADRLKAEKAYDLLEKDLDEAFQAKRELPAVKAELEALRKSVERPQTLNATLKAPAQPKAGARLPKTLEVISLAVAAEIVRRRDHTPVADFLKEVRPGDKNRLVRRHAEKAASDPAYTNVAGWAIELTDTILGSMFTDEAPTAVLPQLLGQGARLLDFRGANGIA